MLDFAKTGFFLTNLHVLFCATLSSSTCFCELVRVLSYSYLISAGVWLAPRALALMEVFRLKIAKFGTFRRK